MNLHMILASAGMKNNDLFSDEWTQGDLSKIAPLVRIGSMISVCTLSIVGFGIILSVLFRYAMGALVATNPKLCDRIDEVHRMKAAQMIGTVTNAQGNELSAIMGFVPMLILSVLPNIKAITDFDDETLDVKTFFFRGLPQAVVFMFVGVFIFYGYTTKIGEKTATFATTLIDIFFLQTDPVAWAEAIPTKFVKYNLSTDNAIDYRNQMVNKVAVNAAKTYFGRLTDVTKEARPGVALDIENWVMEELQAVSDYLDENKYDLQYTSATQIGQKELDRYNNATTTQKTYAFQAPLNQFNSGSVLPEAETHWLRVELVFTAIAEKPTNQSINSRIEGGQLSMSSNKGYSIDLGKFKADGASLTFGTSGRCYIDKKAYDYDVRNSSGSMVIDITGSGMSEYIKKNPGITALTIDIVGTYTIGNFTSKIEGISTDSSKTGNDIQFKASGTSGGVSSWVFGDNPGLKADTGESNDEDEDDDDTETRDNGDTFS